MKKKGLYMLAVICMLFLLLKLLSPIALLKDGLVTKITVENFERQYIYEDYQIRRHDGTADFQSVYLFSFGFAKPQIESEGSGKRIAVQQMSPFFYKWEFRPGDRAYKVTIGDKKYYFAYLLN